MKKLNEIIDECRHDRSFSNTKTYFNEYSKLFRNELASHIICTLINDCGLVDVSEEHKIIANTKQEKELGFVEFSALAKGLKTITYKCIELNDEVYFYEQKGEKAIQGEGSATANIKHLYEKYKEKVIVIFYPFFFVEKNGVLNVYRDNVVIEAVNKDLWNWVSHFDVDITIISDSVENSEKIMEVKIFYLRMKFPKSYQPSPKSKKCSEIF